MDEDQRFVILRSGLSPLDRVQVGENAAIGRTM